MSAKKIVLNKTEIDSIDLSTLNKYVEWHSNFQYFNLEAGKEHYKLLAYLSKTLECKKLIDIGTYLGYSAVALSFDDSKHIDSYDIFDWIPTADENKTTVAARANVKTHVSDYISDLANICKDTDLVMIDIDHSGATEREIMQTLRDCRYTGLVLIDDTKLNAEMIRFFADIPEKKLDISAVGHHSGTGLVIMDPTRFEVSLA